MSYKRTDQSGKTFHDECDLTTGMITQNPNSTPPLFASAGDWQVGIPMVFRVKCSGAGPNFPIFNKNSPFKAVPVLWWGIMTGAGAASDTLTFQVGDGAGSETFTTIGTALDLASAGDTDIIMGSEITDVAGATMPSGGSLRAVTASSAAVDGYIMLVRIQ